MPIKGAIQRSFPSNYRPMSSLTFYGRLQQLDFEGYRFLLDLEGRVKWIIPLRAHLWPGPSAALRRTLGNRWLLYDSGGYQGVLELSGRYYFPAPFGLPAHPFVQAEASRLEEPLAILNMAARRWGIPGPVELSRQAARLRSILKANVPVLPPDTIQVDYDVIPLMAVRGCLHNCSFCWVKTSADPEAVSASEFNQQMQAVKEWIGADIENYSSLFLGQNDGLAAGASCAAEAVRRASEEFHADRVFLFASVASLLRCCQDQPGGIEGLAHALCPGPGPEIHLNIGIESFCQDVLDTLGKPVDARDCKRAFSCGLELCRQRSQLHVSFNFILARRFGTEHMDALRTALAGIEPAAGSTVYLSPLLEEKWRPGELRRAIFSVKAASRLPVFCYFIVPWL